MIPVLARFSFHFHTSKKKLNLFVVLVFRYSVAMVLKFRNRLVHHFEKRRKRCRRKKEVHLETSDGRRGTYKKAKKKIQANGWTLRSIGSPVVFGRGVAVFLSVKQGRQVASHVPAQVNILAPLNY